MSTHKLQTLQDFFNTAYLGLAAQGWNKAEDTETAACQYRAPNGRKCAIGQCISDDEWKEHKLNEHLLMHDIMRRVWGIREDTRTNTLPDRLRQMQGLHDGACNPTDMKNRFDEFAQICGLSIPELPDVQQQQT